MGSFDELITPFMMDSVENFEFDENGEPIGKVKDSLGGINGSELHCLARATFVSLASSAPTNAPVAKRGGFCSN